MDSTKTTEVQQSKKCLQCLLSFHFKDVHENFSSLEKDICVKCEKKNNKKRLRESAMENNHRHFKVPKMGTVVEDDVDDQESEASMRKQSLVEETTDEMTEKYHKIIEEEIRKDPEGVEESADQSSIKETSKDFTELSQVQPVKQPIKRKRVSTPRKKPSASTTQPSVLDMMSTQQQVTAVKAPAPTPAPIPAPTPAPAAAAAAHASEAPPKDMDPQKVQEHLQRMQEHLLQPVVTDSEVQQGQTMLMDYYQLKKIVPEGRCHMLVKIVYQA